MDLQDVAPASASREGIVTLGLGDPHIGGDRLLGEVVRTVERFAPARVVIGDVGSLRRFLEPAEIRRSVAILSTLLAEASIPLAVLDRGAACGAIADALLGWLCT